MKELNWTTTVLITHLGGPEEIGMKATTSGWREIDSGGGNLN